MSSSPRVWVLLGRGAGGNGQLLSLAQALGWPYETRRLVHNALHLVPNLLLGATAISVDRRRSDALAPPWPDLVLAAGRRSAPVSRWIGRQSGGRARLVHLLHAQVPLDAFDLVISLPHYRLAPRDNVLVLTGALNRMDPAQLGAAGAAWKPRLEHLPRPWIAVVAGGDSSSYRFSPEVAARLGRMASEEAHRVGGSLLVSTTPRTSAPAADALLGAIDAPSFCYRFKPGDPDNPYPAFLALADRFVVTVDSASLPVEASATGRPVQVMEWPRRGGARLAPLRGLRGRLAWWGLFKPARDFEAYHRGLRERGLTTRLGDGPPRVPSAPPDDLERAVERVRGLFRDGPGDSV